MDLIDTGTFPDQGNTPLISRISEADAKFNKIRFCQGRRYP